MKIIKGRRGIFTATITTAGTAFNLTDYSAKLTMALRPGDTPVVDKDGVIAAPVTGVITFTVLPDDTKDIAESDYPGEVNIFKTTDPTMVYTPIIFIGEVREGVDPTPVPDPLP